MKRLCDSPAVLSDIISYKQTNFIIFQLDTTEKLVCKYNCKICQPFFVPIKPVQDIFPAVLSMPQPPPLFNNWNLEFWKVKKLILFTYTGFSKKKICLCRHFLLNIFGAPRPLVNYVLSISLSEGMFVYSSWLGSFHPVTITQHFLKNSS